MAIHIGRRGFITTLGGAAAWPLTVRAQQPGLPVVGVLRADTPSSGATVVAALRPKRNRLRRGTQLSDRIPLGTK
jgi:hypothetical protein